MRTYQYKFLKMLSKLVDGASKLKAKIGGDELDERLVEVVSEENWQASTQQLHEIANAAYNYEKWQRINEFIWDKLKKSKSWKKILKTFNLIQFLLKNGPPSIISNFKYDLYQLRVFESYSNYHDGLDKGEPIRERAKSVVGLLSNQEQLEEQRLKAKTIREKMSNVVGGSAYSGNQGYGGSYGYGGSGSSNGSGGYSNSGYGSKQDKKKNESSKSYDYGNNVGHFGDYSGDNKSNLDKYKNAKNQKPASNNYEVKNEDERKPEIQADAKKPFGTKASKLSKPGQKKQVIVEEETVVSNNTTTPANKNSGNIIDIFDAEPSKPAEASAPFAFEQPAVTQPTQPVQPTQPIQAPVQVPPQQQPFVQPVQPPAQLPQQYLPQQPQGQYPQQLPTQYPQQPPQYPPQQPYSPYGQPTHPQQSYGYPGQPQVPQQPAYNQYGQPQPQPQYGQPHNPYAPQQGYPPAQPAFNPNQPNQGYQGGQAAPAQFQQAPQQPVQGGITLSTGKKDEQFGKFSTSNLGTAQNVEWLSNNEKGLIDFSDFGSELKPEKKAASGNNEHSNNIQIDAWSW